MYKRQAEPDPLMRDQEQHRRGTDRKMATIFDVAKEAGVSKSTVSRVINKDPKVKAQTRIAVEQAIRKLNYSPSYFAKGIRTGRTKTIAMLVPEYTNVFYGEMFRGVDILRLQYRL